MIECINVEFSIEEVRDALELSPDQMVMEIRRVIKKRGIPVAIDIKYIPYKKGTPIIELELQYAVFPELVSKEAPFAVQTRMEIGAELPDEEIALELDCPCDRPLLVVYRWLTDRNGRLIGYGIKYMLKEYGRLSAMSGYEPE